MFKSLKKWFSAPSGPQASPLPVEATDPRAGPPVSAAELKQRGNEALDQGDLKQAATSYRAALGLLPSDVGLLVNLGYALSQQELMGEALPHLAKAARLAPTNEDAFYFLALAERGVGRAGDAIEHLRAALALRGDFLVCRLDLCRSLAERAEHVEARTLVEDGLALHPDSADLHYYLGNLQHLQGDLPAAVQSLQRALALAPAHAGVHRNLSAIACEEHRLEDALRHHAAAQPSGPADIVRVMQLSAALHGAGFREQATECARQAAEIEPASPQAQQHRALLQQLYEPKPGAPAGLEADLYANLGAALLLEGRPAAAAEACERAAALNPRHVEARTTLGRAQLNLGHRETACDSFTAALATAPDHADALIGLAEALEARGLYAEALPCRERIAQLHPTEVVARLRLADTLHSLGRRYDAIEAYRAATRLDPRSTEAMANMAVVQQECGDLDSAVASHRAALVIDPSYAQGYCNLASALHLQGKYSEAVSACRAAIALVPTYAQAYNNMGVSLSEAGNQPAALEAYRQALSLDPKLVDAHVNFGAIQQVQSQLFAAEASYRSAVALCPGNALAHGNLGSVLQEMGEHDAAVGSLQHALAINPEAAMAQYTLLFTLNYHPDKTAQEIYAAYRAYDERVGLPLRSTWRPHSNARDPHRRLRVGYVSPDFRKHSVRHFLEPLMAHHDKRAVEVFAYAEVAIEDDVTARYRGHADHWVRTIGLTDDALADRIRSDAIDVIVDLAGHTAKNRLLALARKPAPVAVSWLGFGYTTGLCAIDYMLTDAASAPVGSEELFAEEPWRLKRPAFAYRPADGMGSVDPLPALQRGFLTFGTLTRSVRLNHRSIRVWSQILNRVPQSRLVIDSGNFRDPEMSTRLLAKFAGHGIEANRLEIGFHTPPWDVLRGMDIGLDCFPHNSGTTLFEFLYMGIPYVTLAGRPSVGRLGSSILEGLGRPEWIALTEDDYVERVVALASDWSRLATLRAGLRAELQASPLMDEPGFARHVENAYREMFARWAALPASAC